MKALKGNLFLASLVLVEGILLALLLGGCGGGSGSVSAPPVGGGNVAGGGNAGGGSPPDFRSVAQSAVDPIVAQFSTMNAFSASRRARSGGCPRYILHGDTTVEMDFGDGCYSPDLGERAWGKAILTVVDPHYDYWGDLVDFSRIDVRLDNLGTASEGTRRGSMSLRNIGRDDALGVSLDITTIVRCEERLLFNGTIAYRYGWLTDYATFNGEGQYQAPAYGTINFQMTNILYETDGCTYPVGGTVTMTDGRVTGTAVFSRLCGYAQITDGMSAAYVNLRTVEPNPCGVAR